MFAVARAHIILTTKFSRSFFFFFLNDACIHKSLKCRKICYKIMFDLNMLKTSVVFWFFSLVFVFVFVRLFVCFLFLFFVLFCFVLFRFVLFCFVLFCFVLFCFLLISIFIKVDMTPTYQCLCV